MNATGKSIGRAGGLLALTAALSLVVSACGALPPVITGAEPTRNVFAPAVSSAGEGLSPLQPTAATPDPVEAIATALALATDEALATNEAPIAAEGYGLRGAVWQWTSSTFTDGTVLAPDEPARYTVEFLPDGNALILADCNFGTGLYKEDGDSLTIGAIGATKIACPPDSLDSAFLAQLTKVERFRMTGDTLALLLQDEAGEMQLASQEPRAAPTAEPTATLLPTSTPQPTETRPSPSPSPSEPPVVATSAPTSAPVPTLPAPTALPTLSPPTAEPPTATPLPPPTPTTVELPGTAWTLRELFVGGERRAPAGEAAPTLSISADNLRVSGSTGCNEYRAGLNALGDRIEFAGVALLTRRACDWPVMLQEVELVDALQQAASYSIQGNELILNGESGETLATFELE